MYRSSPRTTTCVSGRLSRPPAPFVIHITYYILHITAVPTGLLSAYLCIFRLLIMYIGRQMVFQSTLTRVPALLLMMYTLVITGIEHDYLVPVLLSLVKRQSSNRIIP